MSDLATSLFQLMPSLSRDEYAALKADIAQRGVLVPIEKDELGNVLDGHHRLQIVAELKADGFSLNDPCVVVRPGMTDQEKRSHVRALNCHRRHLNTEQKRHLLAEELKENPARSDRQIASEYGVSHVTVSSEREKLEVTGQIDQLSHTTGADGKNRPRQRTPKTHTAGIFAKTEREAERIQDVLTSLPVEALPKNLVDTKCLERIGREYNAAQRAASAVVPTTLTPGGADIRHGDFRQVLNDLADSSVDLVLTDPPYPEEYLLLWDDLGRFAARALKPGGCLLAYSGQYHLPFTVGTLSNHLDYLWTLAVIESGAHCILHTRRIHSNWKPIFLFSKGRSTRESFLADVLHKRAREKDLHDWQQGEMEASSLIERLTVPGALVVDPFLGSGTVGAAAVKLGRKFVGCDVDAAAIVTARERIQ